MFLLRTGRRPAMGLKAWTERYLAWVQQIHFSQPAQEFTLLDYLHEVQHMDERVKRLEQAIAEAVKLASPQVREVIRGLQAGGRQGQEEDHHRGRARIAGLRLGHRDQSGNGRQAADGGMTKSDPTKAKAKTFPRRKKQRRSNE
jgi:hypothetical protein